MSYLTGFCSTGACEGTNKLSPSGKPLGSCRGVYLISPTAYGRPPMEFKCSCECHEAFAEIREMMAGMGKIVNFPPPVTSKETAPVGVPSGTAARPAASELGPTTGTPDVGLSPPVPSRRAFTPTPTGRAPKGQLEELVRQVLKQSVTFVPLGTVTPGYISRAISKEKPPSQGAVGAVMDRWEKRNFITIGRKPLRIASITELGKRTLLK